MSVKIEKFFLLLILFLGACNPVQSPSPELENVRLKLNWQDGVQFLGFYVADKKGFYAEEGLSVSIDPLTDIDEYPTLIQKLVDGDYNFSIMADVEISQAQAEGLLITPLSTILRLNPSAFFTRSDTGIVTPADFKGHTVAVKSELWKLRLGELLATVNLNLEDVILVDAGFDMTPFYEGKVDIWAGFLTNEVVNARQEGLDLITFPLYEYGILNTGNTIFTSQELVENRPELLVHFLRASLRGWQWTIDNPSDSVDLMLERFPEMADNREFHLVSFAAYIPLVKPPNVEIGAIDCAAWLDNELFAEFESTEGFCTTEIFEQAVEDNS